MSCTRGLPDEWRAGLAPVRRRAGPDTIAPMSKLPLRFAAVIRIRGVNPYVSVSRRRAGQLQKSWRRPLPVLIRINGQPARKPWPINMMPAGDGSFYLYLHQSVRDASGRSVGDRVVVELDFDRAYRNGPLHPMPRWFRDALRSDTRAKRNWSRLPPSRRKEILRYFAGLRSAEAKARNLARAMVVLSGKSGRFMARSWNNGK